MMYPLYGIETISTDPNPAKNGTTSTDSDSSSVSNTYLQNYLAPAVVVTFICCMPLGAVALIYAAQVNGRQIAGDWQEARKSSESARLWCWIAFGAGIVFWTFYIILIVVIMILGSTGRL